MPGAWSLPAIRGWGLIALVGTLAVPTAWAQSPPAAPSPNAPRITIHRLTLPEGGDESFRLIRRKAAFEGRTWDQVSVEFMEERTAAPDTRREILRGKDTDGDGRLDAWFYSDADRMIQAVDRVAREADGWDVAREIILERIRPTDRGYVGYFARQLIAGLAALSFSGSSESTTLAEIEMAQYFQAEMELRVARLRRNDPHSPVVIEMSREIADNWEDLAREIGRGTFRRQWARAFLDLGIYAGSGPAMKWASARLKALSLRFGESALGRLAEDAYSSYLKGVHLRALEAARRAGKPVQAAASRAHVPLKAAVVKISSRTNAGLAKLDAYGVGGRLAANLIRTVGGIGKNGVIELPYIAGASAVQLAAEVTMRNYWSMNPIVLADRIRSDGDLLYNLKYMSSESFLLTGTTAHFGAGWKSIRICAVISAVNSSAMNIFVKGEADPVRVAFDTGWEVSIGNLQTQLDRVILDRASEMSRASGNSRYRVAGFALAMLDQGAGFAALVPASNWVESGKAREALQGAREKLQDGYGEMERAYFRWIADHGGKEADGREPLQNPRFAMVPILMPL